MFAPDVGETVARSKFAYHTTGKEVDLWYVLCFEQRSRLTSTVKDTGRKPHSECMRSGK